MALYKSLYYYDYYYYIDTDRTRPDKVRGLVGDPRGYNGFVGDTGLVGPV